MERGYRGHSVWILLSVFLSWREFEKRRLRRVTIGGLCDHHKHPDLFVDYDSACRIWTVEVFISEYRGEVFPELRSRSMDSVST